MNGHDMNPQATADHVAVAMMREDRACQALGIAVASIAPGRAVMTMTVRPDMLNGFGICHGGLIATLADSAFAYACNAYNELTVASGLSVDFLAPGREGDLGRGVGRLPGARGDGGEAVEAVETVLAVEVIGSLGAQMAGREYAGHKVGRIALVGPAGPGLLQEIQVVGGVDTGDRRQAEIRRRPHFAQLLLAHPGQHMVGARRHLEAGFQFAADHLSLSVVQAVVVAVVGQHLVVLRGTDGAILGPSTWAGER